MYKHTTKVTLSYQSKFNVIRFIFINHFCFDSLFC